MADIDEVSRDIGRLQGTLEGVAANQIAHQARDDAQHSTTQGLIGELTKHVNHENDLMSGRIDTLEKDKEHRTARNKFIGSSGALLATVVTIIVLALAVPWHDIHI